MEEKQDNPLIPSQSFECDIWMALPVRGTAPKSIHFSSGLKPSEHAFNVDYDHSFEQTDALYHTKMKKIYTFHTTLNQKSISNCSLSISDDDILQKSAALRQSEELSGRGITVNLIPEPLEHAFWDEEEVLILMIVRHGKVHFRGQMFKSRHIIWEVIEHGSYKKEDHQLGDKVLKDLQEKHDSWDSGHQDKDFKESFGTNDISLICLCWLFPKECVNVSTFEQIFGYNQMEEDICRKLDFSPFRASLQSSRAVSDLFAKALRNVRQNFVSSLPVMKSEFVFHDSLKRRFDQRFLDISNMKADGKRPYFIVFDDRKQELNFVDINPDKLRLWAPEGWMFERRPETTNISIQGFVRHNWVKYQCLLGQDDEFNIFRSLCFAPPSTVDERYHIGFMALTLQILLCFGITVDSWDKWADTTIEDVWDFVISLEYELADLLIGTISILTFAFVLQRLRKTIHSFKRFYQNMDEVCIIPTVVIVLDLTSNIIVGSLMAIATPFFLLQSEDIQTVVLNSFALTFFIELDDMANIFESDEPFLLQEDANGMKRTRKAMGKKKVSGVVKRRIGGNLSGCESLQMVGMMLFSPLYESYKIIVALLNLCGCCCKKKQD